jgi:hypothetical protein
MFLETFRARSFWGDRVGTNLESDRVDRGCCSSFGVPDSARADNCLTAPNSSAPQGSHWYYRTDRANQRKCWYFRASGEPAQQATAQATSEAAPAAQAHGTLSTPPAGAPMSISPSDVAPPSPHAKMLAVSRVSRRIAIGDGEEQRGGGGGKKDVSRGSLMLPRDTTVAPGNVLERL